jgi:hypothetical protein
LKDFHPAVLRPGRFDEVIHIDSLDEGTVRSVLGEYADAYYEGAKTLPIAYISEFVKKAPSLPNDDSRKTYLEQLNGRAKKAAEDLAMLKKPEELLK